MNTKEIKAKVMNLLDSGISKTDVFALLSGKGMKDQRLAYFIAAYIDPHRRSEHAGIIKIIVAIMLVQALFAFVFGFTMGIKQGPITAWLVGGFAFLIQILFAWGIHKDKVGFYNAYILLAIIQLPKSVEGFAVAPIATLLGLVIGIGILAFVWYVRSRLFPDFAWFSPKKTKGRYVFAT